MSSREYGYMDRLIKKNSKKIGGRFHIKLQCLGTSKTNFDKWPQ